MKLPLLLLASAGTSAVVGSVLVLALSHPANSEPGDAASEVATLRAQVEEMTRELSTLRGRVESQSATASFDGAPVRTATAAPKPAAAAGDDGAPVIEVPRIERDMILAVIEQREKDKDRERKEKQRQMAREGIEAAVKRAADRVGLDGNTASTIAQLYIDNLGREEDIRRAYPVRDPNDPNAEKARIEIDAARASLDSTVSAMIPADKLQDWNNQTRWIRRAGDMLYGAEQAASGNFNMFGGMFGRGGMDFGGGPPQWGNNRGERGAGRQGRDGQTSAAGVLINTPPAPKQP